MQVFILIFLKYHHDHLINYDRVYYVAMTQSSIAQPNAMFNCYLARRQTCSLQRLHRAMVRRCPFTSISLRLTTSLSSLNSSANIVIEAQMCVVPNPSRKMVASEHPEIRTLD